MYTLLKCTSIMLTLLQTAFFIYFVVKTVFNGYMLTWWGQVVITLYLWILTVALFVQGWLLWIAIVILLPIVSVLILDINVSIVIIVSQNGTILDDPDLSESDEYVGNWLIHTLGVIIIWAMLLNAGLLLLARAIIGDMWRKLSSNLQRALYAAFFVLAPLFPPFVYTRIWSISEHYPTGISDGVLWLALFGLNLVVALFLLMCIVISDQVVIDVPTVRSFTAWHRRLAQILSRGVDGASRAPSISPPTGPLLNVFETAASGLIASERDQTASKSGAQAALTTGTSNSDNVVAGSSTFYGTPVEVRSPTDHLA